MNVPASFLLTLRRFDRALTSRVDRIRAQAASIDAEYERRERAAYVALRSVQYRDADRKSVV